MADQDSRTRLRSRTQITKKHKPKPPPCKEMIRLAIIGLKEAKGTPRDAILNYICTNYDIRNKTIISRRLSIALKTGVNDGSFRQSKGPYTIVRYSIVDTNDSETHRVATKTTKRKFDVKAKAAQVTKSNPVQNKRKITSKQTERADKNMCLVKSKVALNSDRCKRRKVSKEEARSNKDIAQTTKTLKEVKSRNNDASFTTEDKKDIRNE